MAGYVVGQVLRTDRIGLIDIVAIDKDARATRNPILCSSSVVFLKPSDQVSMADLNKDAATQSDNSACIVLIDYIARGQESFIGLVNGYAKGLGLTNTTLQTVHGLDAPEQFSTARGMALPGKTLIHDVPEEYVVHKGEEFTFDKIRQPNRDRLLWSGNLNADGMKTRTTTGAGYNLVASAAQGDMCLISVVLRTKIGRIRFNESGKLLTWSLHFFETVTPVKPDTTFVTQRVWFGDKSEVNLGAGEAGSVIILCGQLESLKASYTLTKPQLITPLEKNQAVDTIDFQFSSKSIEQCPLIMMENVEEDGFSGRAQDFAMMKSYQWFDSWFS